MENVEKLKNEIEKLLKEVKKMADDESIDYSNHKIVWDKMVDKAFELHKIVKPKHHKYMIENRRCTPNEREFYNHIHPIEDLLAFVEDSSANDDPEDQTIGHEFKFKVYTRRWGHDDVYRLRRNEMGWVISNMMTSGQADKLGKATLYDILNHDSVNYPEELPGYMEWLWEQAEQKGLNHEEVQESLDELAAWISICEKNSPTGIFGGYK